MNMIIDVLSLFIKSYILHLFSALVVVAIFLIYTSLVVTDLKGWE